MTGNEISMKSFLYHSFHDCYNVKSSCISKSVIHDNGIAPVPINDTERISNLIKDKIRRFDSSDFQEGDTFSFVKPNLINRVLEPRTFICKQCRHIVNIEDHLRRFNLRDARTALRCPRDDDRHTATPTLYQIPHVFVHSRCGRVEEVRQMFCRNCKTEMELNFNSDDIGGSYWECRRCYHSSSPELKENGRRLLMTWCYECSRGQEEGDANRSEETKMRLVTARTARRAQAFSSIYASGNWKEFLSKWLGIKINREVDASKLPDYVKKAMETDPGVREAILKQMGYEQIDEKEIGNIEKDVRDELTEFSGIYSQEGTIELESVDPETAAAVKRTFGISALYADGLPIIEGVYGYTAGTYSNSAKLILFSSTSASDHRVFVRDFRTEAIVLTLDSENVKSWLKKNGIEVNGDLKKHMLTADAESPEVLLLRKMLHSISHLMIKKSDIYSGVSRETLSEIIFPRALSFVLYNTAGSTQGSLKTTFESLMFQWISGARAGAETCIYDPLCSGREKPCHACMFIAERNCSGFFNQELDRALVFSKRGGVFGFWGSIPDGEGNR